MAYIDIIYKHIYYRKHGGKICKSEINNAVREMANTIAGPGYVQGIFNSSVKPGNGHVDHIQLYGTRICLFYSLCPRLLAAM